MEVAGGRNALNETYRPLVTSHPTVAVSYIAALAVAALVGTVGNLCVIASLLAPAERRRKGNIFIVNLALSDLIVTAVVDPLNIVGKTRNC